MTAVEDGTRGRPAKASSSRTAGGSDGARPAAVGWRDGLFIGLACAGLARALHGAEAPAGAVRRILDGSIQDLLTPAVMVGASLPLVLGLAALAGPLLIRMRWQAGVLALGLAWFALVIVALLQERAFGQSFEVAEAAWGLAALVGLAFLLKLRRVRPGRPGCTGAAPATAPG